MSSAERDPDLGEMEVDEEFTFPPSERKLLTQPVDLSIQTLVEQWNSRLLILPEIQRQYVWDDGKASRLIESLLLNIPIPVLYFAETTDAKYEVIDGHQRVYSIVRYVGNEFSLSGLAVLREYKGLRFHQLPDREQRFLRMRTLRAILILVDSHPNMKFEIFERLNTGGVSLNAQELRNSIYRGPFNRLLHELASDPTLRGILGSKAPRPRMIDEELLLRYFALYNRLDSYRPPLKRFLNTYMQDFQNAEHETLADLRAHLTRTIGRVSTLLQSGAFRVTDQSGQPLEKSINRALFDAHMLACAWISGGELQRCRRAVIREFAALYASPDFLDAIQRATGDRSRTLRRVRDTVDALTRAGLELVVPFDLSE